MSGIRGELCETDELLEATAKAKKRDFLERRTEKGEELTPPWEKIGTKWRRPKMPDELFEDRVWLLLYDLGFKFLNKDRRCFLEYKTYSKQHDVLGRDDLYVFAIQCRTTESEENNISARPMFTEFVAHKGDIRKAFQEKWGHDSFSRVCHVVALGSREKKTPDEDYIRQNPSHNLHLWSLNDIEYMEQLVKAVGPIAKQQLYAVMFAGKKNSELERTYPAIKTRIGGKTIYNFFISAKELADYVYVHHRKLTSLSDASEAYQRMLRPKKLEQIKDFIDTGGYFANNIILNFNQQLEFLESKRCSDTVEMGKVKLPGSYGCAWIIDGQHRLYGAASATKEVLLPVIALEQISEAKQAELFIEINKKQTAVEGNLLWDLYSDIYQGSELPYNEQPDEAKFWLISEIAKRLGRNGSLQKKIKFESELSTHKAPLTLNTVCTSIKQNCPWKILDKTGAPDEKAKHITRIIECFFSALRELKSEEWDDPNANCVILTNNGFAVFFLLFSDIIKHFDYYDQKSLFLPANKLQLVEEMQKLLEPAVQFISEPEHGKNVKSGTARGLQMDNARKIAGWINSFYKKFIPPRLDVATTDQAEKPPLPTGILELAASFEPKLREFVLKKLIEWHGKNWWTRAIPNELKIECDKKWVREVKEEPALQNHSDSNKRKYEYCDITRITKIIKHNWGGGETDGFMDIFLFDENEVERRINDVKAARDPEQHKRESSGQIEVQAAARLRWFSQVLEDKSLNPFKS